MIKGGEPCFRQREQHRQRPGGENKPSALGELQGLERRRERGGWRGSQELHTKGLKGLAEEVKVLKKALGATEGFGEGKEPLRIRLSEK